MLKLRGNAWKSLTQGAPALQVLCLGRPWRVLCDLDGDGEDDEPLAMDGTAAELMATPAAPAAPQHAARAS